ncbi:hypothetical protein [Magnetovibrio blakemorei]|uniref:Uncharacterized protein n=1 Tax=Magnetovibrio blakemorei TaxID=28181 RepID=A0A1E5Q8D4_9PROT|nr:hypothetical protein [Magnetovibrio blakemorei]OEJ67623.1 hypothetical protein BEN30_09390 [Magnetovibrio blakemorei]
MPFINAVGGALFGDGYAELTAQSDPGFQVPLEVLEQPKPPQGGVLRKTQTSRMAERIKSLLDDPHDVIKQIITTAFFDCKIDVGEALPIKHLDERFCNIPKGFERIWSPH